MQNNQMVVRWQKIQYDDFGVHMAWERRVIY